MPKPHTAEVVPPDRGGSSPPSSVAGPVKRPEIDRVPSENSSTFLNWRARRLDDDPALADAWARFYREYAQLLRVVVGRSRRRLVDPDDATQEAWLILISRFSIDLTGEASDEFRAQVVVAIRNHLADLKRRARRRRFEPLVEDEADALVGREEDPATTCDRDLVGTLVCAVLEEARDRVSELSHRIIVLRWLEGRTAAEIAETLGMTVAQVRDRHRRVFPVIRRRLIRRFGADFSWSWAERLDGDFGDLDLVEVVP
jgi:RNA polymerase sigma factor (sigma-70 family)